ncbi:hypothetical protein LP421_30960 (plasmid) [Rhizobium sp. RCAM05350]|nr:hypothetical protein LP421_30960 [Rhizobium sp. RCAM05350]
MQVQQTDAVGEFPAKEHIHIDRLLVGQRQILIDHLDAVQAGPSWRSTWRRSRPRW